MTYTYIAEFIQGLPDLSDRTDGYHTIGTSFFIGIGYVYNVLILYINISSEFV